MSTHTGMRPSRSDGSRARSTALDRRGDDGAPAIRVEASRTVLDGAFAPSMP